VEDLDVIGMCVPKVMVGFQNLICIKRNMIHTLNMN
jgi:hypothetical protein